MVPYSIYVLLTDPRSSVRSIVRNWKVKRKSGESTTDATAYRFDTFSVERINLQGSNTDGPIQLFGYQPLLRGRRFSRFEPDGGDKLLSHFRTSLHGTGYA